MTKFELYEKGRVLVKEFAALNNIPTPHIKHASFKGQKQCGEAFQNRIRVDVAACANPGTTSYNWNWPGHIIDRTPYGVLCHEMGHVVDWWIGDGLLVYSRHVAEEARYELPITSYAPNTVEWFAEIFRLFLTNPDLLRLIRPYVYKVLSGDFRSVIKEPWDVVLAQAPARTVEVVRKRIRQAGGTV